MEEAAGSERAERRRFADGAAQKGIVVGAAVVLDSDIAIDPREPRYCYCDQISYGEVCLFA